MGSRSVTKIAAQQTKQVNPVELVIIGLDVPADVTHDLYDPRALMKVHEKFIDDIEARGVLQPINVRRAEDGKLLVIDGRQRVKAAREVNKRRAKAKKPGITIAVIEREIEGVDAVGAVISLNEIRMDDDALDKAAKAARLYELNGKDLAQTAVAFGVTEQAVRNWLSLNRCEPELKEAIRKSTLSASTAAKAAKLSREKQLEFLKESAVAEGEKKKSVRKLDAKVKAKREGKTTAFEAPSRRTLRALLSVQGIHKDLHATIKWILGEGSPKEVRGLKEAIATLAANDEEQEGAEA